jgi:transposase-like protein
MSIETLGRYFAAVEDPRCSGKVEHRLIEVLVIAVCAVIACAESWDDIALYGRSKLQYCSLCNSDGGAAVSCSSCHRRGWACTRRLMLPWRVLVSPLVIGPHGAALPAFCCGSLAQRRQDHAHVRQRVEDVFLRLRWPETDGKPVCPHCDCTTCYACRRPAGQLRWRCKACRGDFSITSGTLFAWHELPLRTYLLAVTAFCNEVKGKSMLAFSRELDVQYKTAFVLAHKLREAIAKRSHGVMSAKPTGRPA